MSEPNAVGTLSTMLTELRSAVLESRKWSELPSLLDRIEIARVAATSEIAVGSGGTGTQQVNLARETLWIDCFAEDVRTTYPLASINKVECTARQRWHGIESYDAAALAKVPSQALPRNFGQ